VSLFLYFFIFIFINPIASSACAALACTGMDEDEEKEEEEEQRRALKHAGLNPEEWSEVPGVCLDRGAAEVAGALAFVKRCAPEGAGANVSEIWKTARVSGGG
jgi:hypothetical protein